MNRGLRRSCVGAVALLCLIGLSPLAFAQVDVETVFFTGPNNQISRIDSVGACGTGPGALSTLLTDGGTNLQGLVVRGDLCLIAANATSGGGLRMYDAAGPASLGQFVSFDSAVAVDVDSSENVLAVNDDPGGADQLWMVPRNTATGCTVAGYDAPVVLDSQVTGAFRLADVKFVRVSPSGAFFAAGDVLVLVRNPGKIVRYTSHDVSDALANHVDAAETAVPIDLGAVEPTGFALTQGGDILVATNGGQVLRFGPDGGSKGTFASFAGSGVDVATGLRGGVEKAFVTVHQGGFVNVYDVASGSCEGSVTGANSPVGVGNASLHVKGSVSTPASSTPVTVAPTSSQQMTFEQVNAPGVTTGDVFIVCDPASGTTHTLTLGGVTRTIPDYVVAADDCSKCGVVGSGCPAYLVNVVGSSAGFYGFTVEHHIQEEALGFDTACYDGSGAPSAKQPRTFYATDADDPPIVEGNSFTDISSGCGSNIGRGGSTSLILTGLDARTPTVVASAKLTNLDLALNGKDACAGGLAPFINQRTLHALGDLLQAATAAFNANDSTGAIDQLTSFIAAVRTGKFTECVKSSKCNSKCRNVPGELISRAVSAQFMICGAGSACNVYKLVP
jgi:hypothetical protein